MDASRLDRRWNAQWAAVLDPLEFFLFLSFHLVESPMQARILFEFPVLLGLPFCEFDWVLRIGTPVPAHFFDPFVELRHSLKVFFHLAQVSEYPPGPWFVVH